MSEHGPEYEQGLRDGRLKSLEEIVKELSSDVRTLKAAIWALYGALALVNLLPALRGMING